MGQSKEWNVHCYVAYICMTDIPSQRVALLHSVRLKYFKIIAFTVLKFSMYGNYEEGEVVKIIYIYVY